MRLMKALLIWILMIFPIILQAQVNPAKIKVNWKTDKEKKSVSLNEFRVLMTKDGYFSTIKSPTFISIAESEKKFYDYEPVLFTEINGESKAYPLSILIYHEIVNDVCGGVPILITYCSLCNSGQIYSRKIELKDSSYLLEFNMAGMIRKSNLIMWDKQTESWWQQNTGQAMVGDFVGSELKEIPTTLISFKNFKENYPSGKVLSPVTGIPINYGTSPYPNYENIENKNLMFYNGSIDSRLPPLERVLEIKIGGISKLYPYSICKTEQIIIDSVNLTPIVIFFEKDLVSILDKDLIKESKAVGSTTSFSPIINGKLLSFKSQGNVFVDIQTGSSWNVFGRCIEGKLKGENLKMIPSRVQFAFSAFLFCPECEIFKK